MPDYTSDAGLLTYYCGRCGASFTDTHRIHLRLPAANLFGDKLDYILICEVCSREMFPRTKIFDRDDLNG